MNTPTKFFVFKQNNSGGSFEHDAERGIGLNVWVEAADSASANARAETIGLYFNGCNEGMDCPCCGDRWSEQWNRDAGSAVPSIYGKEWRAAACDEAPTLDWGIPSYIHRLDGTFVPAVELQA